MFEKVNPLQFPVIQKDFYCLGLFWMNWQNLFAYFSSIAALDACDPYRTY